MHAVGCTRQGPGGWHLCLFFLLMYLINSLKAASCIFTSRVRQASASSLSSAVSLIVITPCEIGKASNLSSRLSVRSNTSFSKSLTFCDLLEKNKNLANFLYCHIRGETLTLINFLILAKIVWLFFLHQEFP